MDELKYFLKVRKEIYLANPPANGFYYTTLEKARLVNLVRIKASQLAELADE